jgi:hypothetical protein
VLYSAIHRTPTLSATTNILLILLLLVVATIMLAVTCILGSVFVLACVLYPHVLLHTVGLGIALKILTVCRSVAYVHELEALLMDPSKQSWLSVLMVGVLLFVVYQLRLRRYKRAENTMLVFMYFLATCLRMLPVFSTSWYEEGPLIKEGDTAAAWSFVNCFLAAFILGQYRMHTVSV